LFFVLLKYKYKTISIIFQIFYQFFLGTSGTSGTSGTRAGGILTGSKATHNPVILLRCDVIYVIAQKTPV